MFSPFTRPVFLNQWEASRWWASTVDLVVMGGLFNDYIASDGRMIDELERIWKGPVLALSQVLSGGTEGNFVKPQSG
jgi:hypothetical protein